MEPRNQVASDASVRLMCICQSSTIGVKRDAVTVDYNPVAYNMKRHQNYGESEIENIWKERCEQNSTLFNGAKYRLHDTTITPLAESNISCHEVMENQCKYVFHLGRTCYRDYLGTNWAPRVEYLTSEGRRLHSNPQAFLSDALGVGGLVKTSDGFMVFIRRSGLCGEAQGMLDVPGGHPEPGSDAVDTEDIVNELFDSQLREITEETNIARCELSDATLLGVVRNALSGGRPTAEFYCSCPSLSGADVRRGYEAGGHAEAFESSEVLLMGEGEVRTLGREGRPAGVWAQLTPSAKGCLMLYAMATT